MTKLLFALFMMTVVSVAKAHERTASKDMNCSTAATESAWRDCVMLKAYRESKVNLTEEDIKKTDELIKEGLIAEKDLDKVVTEVSKEQLGEFSKKMDQRDLKAEYTAASWLRGARDAAVKGAKVAGNGLLQSAKDIVGAGHAIVKWELGLDELAGTFLIDVTGARKLLEKAYPAMTSKITAMSDASIEKLVVGLRYSADKLEGLESAKFIELKKHIEISKIKQTPTAAYLYALPPGKFTDEFHWSSKRISEGEWGYRLGSEELKRALADNPIAK